MSFDHLAWVGRTKKNPIKLCQAASEIFFATRKNQVLKKLNLARNKVGPEVLDSLAAMVRGFGA